jgi:hypothetical protein
MWFVYFDESKQNNSFFVYSALVLDSDQWNVAFEGIKELRRNLRREHGIYMRQELHAWKFAAGKGQIADRPIMKSERAYIFRRLLTFAANPRLFKVISSVNTDEFYAFDRIINRINRTAEAHGQYAILICDEGQEVQFTRRLRRMRVHNPIPSHRGIWQDTGKATKNIIVDRILEDPFFKDSSASYFVQLVDFCAYALLRSERPIPSRSRFGYDRMYEILRPVVVQECNRQDPRQLGIIR